MSDEIVFINLIFILFSTFFCYKHFKFLISSKRSVVDYVYAVFFIFYVLPVFLDVFYSPPKYSSLFAKFEVVTTDFYTVLIYNSLILIFQIILYNKFKNITITSTEFRPFKLNFLVTLFINILIFLPIILFILYPEKEKLLIYGNLSLRNIEEADEFVWLVNSTNLSILMISFLAINKNYSLKLLLKFSPILLACVWINGKRNIIVLLLLIFVYVLLNNNRLKNKLKIFISILVSVFVGLFSQYYLNNFKLNEVEQTAEEKYEILRIDYGRDDVLKMAIYHELYYKYPPILSYRGESMVFVLTFFIPREIWSDKPLTYTAYFTSSLLNEKADFQHFGITTGIFDEFIVNFSLFIGFVFAVYLVIRIIRVTLKMNNLFFNLYTVLILALLLSNDIKSYLIIHILWIVYLVYLKNKNKNKNVGKRSIQKI